VINNKTISIKGAGNEYEGAQKVIQAIGVNIQNVNITVTELINSKSDTNSLIGYNAL
jgi:hypothetical protein